jgi:Mrp family chromosome partitioning ATPase
VVVPSALIGYAHSPMAKRGKFGDRPEGDDQLEVATRAVPVAMPLVTQPMAAVRPESVSARALVHTFDSRPPPLATVVSAAVAAPSSLPDQAPPEIGLTQHHLPEDQPPDRRLILHAEPDSERAAQFRVLRHHMLSAGRPQVIVVTSPGPGDGKTTTAVNLALALAECNRAKVLLVETHLRRPQLAEVFRFHPPWCFAEQLASHRHQPMLPWGVVDIPQLWLHVAAVAAKPDAVQLLDAPAFAIAMERLRLGGYDHIVIDAPPVSGTAEVNLLQDAADGVLLVARARRTTRRQVRDAIDQISTRKVLGTVMLDR